MPFNLSFIFIIYNNNYLEQQLQYHYKHMFEKLLQKILKDVVGEFIDGIDTKKLNIGIWSGTVQIVNVSLKPRLLAMFGLPYRIVYSNISRLYITIPWKNLFTGPMVIEIDSIQILAENSTYQLSRQQQGRMVLLKIKQFIQKLAKDLASTRKSQQKSGGYFQTVYLKMLDNLYLTIKNIHCRFQVSRPLRQEFQSTPFSFGITLQSIQLFAVDQKGNKVFIDRTKLTSDKNIIHKKLKLQNFGFYWNYQQKDTILLTLQYKNPTVPNQRQKAQKYFKQMLDLKQIIGGKGLSKQKINYIIMINAEGIIKQDNRPNKVNKPTIYEISFNIKQLKMIVNEKIIKQMFWFMKQTSEISVRKKSIQVYNDLQKWEGPKNQSFLGLLRKYCINQFWQTDSGGKSTTPLAIPQQRMLVDYLYQNKQNLPLIQTKVKEIIVGDIGNKNSINKSEIFKNWHTIQSMMMQQKKMEGQFSIKFSFGLQQLCIFYVDEVKIPIAQLFMKGFNISADQNQDGDLDLILEIAKLQGFGYDQNALIRIQHEVESPFQDPKLLKNDRLFYLSYKLKTGESQQIQIILGGIGFIYDFKTFRQLYKLPESLMASQPAPKPTSPPSTMTKSQISLFSQSNKQADNQNKTIKNIGKEAQIKSIHSQITISIENISFYIQQYTKKTWRLSLSGCQMTNSESLTPENILIGAISLSVSDFYVLEPFASKIVLNLRNQIPDISVVIEPIKIKVSSESIKCLLKIPSCLGTYKKNDAVSLSSKYGELYLLDEKQVWKKFDGIIIDGLLYLYQKNQQYSKYQLRVVSAVKTKDNKRQIIQIGVKTDKTPQPQKLMLIVRSQPQYEQWVKYLTDLSEYNNKMIAKQMLRSQHMKDHQKTENIPQKQIKQQQSKFNLCAMIENLSLFMLASQKDKDPVLGFIIRKTIIQLINQHIDNQAGVGPEEPPRQSVRKNSPGIDKDKQQQFKSLRSIPFSTQLSKKSSESDAYPQFVSMHRPNKNKNLSQKSEQNKQLNKMDIKHPKKLRIQIKNVEMVHKTYSRLYFQDSKKEDKQNVQESKQSLIIQLMMFQKKMKVYVQTRNKLVLDYQPYQILQILSYLNSQIFSILSTGPSKVGNTNKMVTKSEPDLQKIEKQQKQQKGQQSDNMTIYANIGGGLMVRGYNINTYKQWVAKSVSRQSKKQRYRILEFSAQQLIANVDGTGIRLQMDALNLNWFAQFEDQFHTIVGRLGDTKNKLTVQMVGDKMIVNAYRLHLPNYQHYITMRAIDYLQIQLKQILLNPYTFNEYFESNANSQLHTRQYRLKQYIEGTLTQTQVWERIRAFTNMQVSVIDCYVGIGKVGYLTVGNIHITNAFVNSYNISIKDNILCDQYCIEFKDVNVKLIVDAAIDLDQINKQILSKTDIPIIPKTKHNAQSKVQSVIGQRFYTILDRFSNNLNQAEWTERSKRKTVTVIDQDYPLDMSLIVTMFGKYPQYKTLFRQFQATVANSVMKIKLKLSALHFSLLPHQIIVFNKFINQVMANIDYSDGQNYKYSYDEELVKSICKSTLNKDRSQKPGDSPLQQINTPIHLILKQDEYIYCPIQFNLNILSISAKGILLPNKLVKKLSKVTPSLSIYMQDQNYATKQKIQTHEDHSGNISISGIHLELQNLRVYYTQYPETQTIVAFHCLQIYHILDQEKNKIVQLGTSTSLGRPSRQTMFIDNMNSKKISQSIPTLQKHLSVGDGPKITIHQKNRQNQDSNKSSDKKQMNLSEQKQAFWLKMYRKHISKVGNKLQKIQERSLSENSLDLDGQDLHSFMMKNVKMIELQIQSLSLIYNHSALGQIAKIKSAMANFNQTNIQKQQVQRQKNNEQQKQMKEQQNNQKLDHDFHGNNNQEITQLSCLFNNSMIQFQNKKHSKQMRQSNLNNDENVQTLFLQFKFVIKTQLPDFLPLNINVNYVQSFIENQKNDLKLSMNPNNYVRPQQRQKKFDNRTSQPQFYIKNKRKTLLQPTKITFSRKIIQQITKMSAVSKQEDNSEIKSKIKSIFNFAAKQINQKQLSNFNRSSQIKLSVQRKIIQQIFIGKCFLKLSIQDINLILNIVNTISEQTNHLLTKFQNKQKIQIQEIKNQRKNQNKQIKQIKEIKQTKEIPSQKLKQKASIQEKLNVKNQRTLRPSYSVQNLNRIKTGQNTNSQKLNLTSTIGKTKNGQQTKKAQEQKQKSLAKISQLPVANKIEFNPVQVVIMNQINFAGTPLIYSVFQINDYCTDHFVLQLAANYFNLRINTWEPLIQKCKLLIKLEPWISIQKYKEKNEDNLKNSNANNQKLQKSIKDIVPAKQNMDEKKNPPKQQLKLTDYFNINISTNFLEALIPAIQNTSAQVGNKRYSQTKSAGDEVNCWMLINQLGYEIQIESKDFNNKKTSSTLVIPNNKSRKLAFVNDSYGAESFQTMLNSDFNEYYDQNLHPLNQGDKKNKLITNITIIINNQFKIKQLDIGEIGIKKLCFDYDGQSYWIYRHTYVDISKNVKYIKFYSGVLVCNLTNIELWVKLPFLIDIKNKQQIQTENKIQEGAPNKQQKTKRDRKFSHDKLNQSSFKEKDQFLNVKTWRVKNKSEHHQNEEQDDSNISQRIQTSFRKAITSRPHYVRIPPNKQISLAFDLDESIRKISQNDFSKLLSIEAPVEDTESDLQNKKQKNGQIGTLAKYRQFQIQKQNKKMRTIYKILPTGKIINKLPETLNLAFKADQHILYAFTMLQDQTEYIYTSFNELQLSIHADGFQWSSFISCGIMENVSLLDFNNNKLNIKINLFFDEDGIMTAVLYPIAVLYNETDYELYIRDPQAKNYSYTKVFSKKGISLSNNRILVFKPNLELKTGYSSKDTSYTKVYMSQDEIGCKFEITPVNNKLMQQPKIAHHPTPAIQSLLITQVSLKTVSGNSPITSMSQRINTKFVTVSHKFYFNNHTQYTILVRKHITSDPNSRFKQSNFDIRTYKPYSKQSFWLFQDDAINAKQNLTLYELTIKDSPYDWSGALSITKQGNNHFVLRDRAHFNDAIFFNLIVVKYHNIDKYKIQLKFVDRQQAPFKIRNSLPQSIIKLPQYGNLILNQGQQIQFSWDEPVLKGGVIPILIGYPLQGNMNKINYNNFVIKAQNPQQNELIKFKRMPQTGQVYATQSNATRILQIREYQKMQRKTQKMTVQIDFPIRIGIINNSFTPAYHLCDLSTILSLKISKVMDDSVIRLNLDAVQLDNQTRYRVYFPVVLSTSLSITAYVGKNIQVELLTQPINLNVEQDFGRDLYATAMLVSALVSDSKEMEGEHSLVDQDADNKKAIISKLTLPKVTIKLQVKTKKLSIQTTINLQKPAVTKYPWQSFPYPIKNIIINLLSHLSISPWSVISSFQKGVVALLTQQQSTKGIQGFFGQIIAALSNSVSGLVGILVGHDIERVDNFFDGLQQGTNLLCQQVLEIKDSFEPEQCTAPSILKSLGYGIISIVLKPMKGVLQMTLKISQGIKKTALFSFESSQAKYRQRDMIVFYGLQQKFKTYDPYQSQFLVMLLKVCGQPLKYLHVVRFYLINNKLTNASHVLCIGVEQVILFDAKSQKLIWQINLHQVTEILIVRYSTIVFRPYQFEVDALHQDVAQEITQILSKIRKKGFVKI